MAPRGDFRGISSKIYNKKDMQHFSMSLFVCFVHPLKKDSRVMSRDRRRAFGDALTACNC